jgi:hypothetical protein
MSTASRVQAGSTHSRVFGQTRRRRFMARAHHNGPPGRAIPSHRLPLLPEVPWIGPSFTLFARACSTR